MKQDLSTTPAKPAMPAMQDTTPLALSTSVPWQGKRIVRAWSWFMAVAVLVVLGFVLVWPDSSASIAQPAVGRQPDPFVAATKALRPSVVAVGSYVRTDNPTVKYFGTGFVIDDGLTVVTNAHVVAALRQAQRLDQLRIYFPDSRDVDGREAKVLIEDAFHDVALIQFAGRPAPTVNLAPAPHPRLTWRRHSIPNRASAWASSATPPAPCSAWSPQCIKASSGPSCPLCYLCHRA